MTLNNIEASLASLEWIYTDRTVKRSNVGGYMIQVTNNQGRYQYTALRCGAELVAYGVASDDRKGQELANVDCMMACAKHWSVRSLRAKAYAAVGGAMLAKCGYGVISGLDAEQLSIVIDSPKRLIDFIGGDL